MSEYRKKLIEVALPLEAINRESAREKSIRHGHPSTLHMWWARRPLAACRAVLFAQLVDDPSSNPEKFPTELSQSLERNRLFELINRSVVWEDCDDVNLLNEMREAIEDSVGRLEDVNFLDPFAGGGSIPLEAQRLGLNSTGSDLNPIPVMINRCLLDLPNRFQGTPPVHPEASAIESSSWPRATGLAEDIKRYAKDIWLTSLEELRKYYPEVGEKNDGTNPVVAWLWARTVVCPNPSCGISAPLIRNFWLSQKPQRRSWLEPVIENNKIEFHVTTGAAGPQEKPTVSRTGGRCIKCGTAIPLTHIREAGVNGKLGTTPMALVVEGERQRVYKSSSEVLVPERIAIPEDFLDTPIPKDALGFRVFAYGLTKHADLFTQRQTKTLLTYSKNVVDSKNKITMDAIKKGLSQTHAEEYADIVITYLSLAVSRTSGSLSNLNTWNPAPSMETVNNVFKMQSLSMVWDFAESNPFRDGPASLSSSSEWVARVVERLPAMNGHAEQADASSRSYQNYVISTDPPYYDNVGYADLSDFFYIWLRKSLPTNLWPEFNTVLTPKSEELIADPARHASADEANSFFEEGFKSVFQSMHGQVRKDIPITVFYAFKQQQTDNVGTASTGWEALLEGMIKSGWQITATWPVRTERTGRPRDNDSNALASSIVLACRTRSTAASSIMRRAFVNELKESLPVALKNLQDSNVAPVDLAQAAIGPGMAIFSKYSKIIEADGADMSVRVALAIINQVLAEVLSDQEGDFDSETRFCIKWFEQFGWNESASSVAIDLSRAINTSITTLERGGIFRAAAGKARLLRPEEMSKRWNPDIDKSVSIWEVAVRIAFALQSEGADKAAELSRDSNSRVDMESVKELTYLIFSISEKKGWVDTAMLFNSLGSSWSDLSTSISKPPKVTSQQNAFDFTSNLDNE